MTTTPTWDDKEWATFRKWLKSMLEMGEVKVSFVKKDGDKRVMKCTLDPSLLPIKPITENKTPRKTSDATLAVYDLKAKGWRSFTVKSVTQIAFTI